MYFPHTPAEKEAMLRVIGMDRIEDLFQDVPAAHRFPDLKSALRADGDGSADRASGVSLGE